MKDLKDKAIKIQGKDYVLVSDRVIYFNGKYPHGCITTELVSDPESDQVIVKATVYPDVEQMAQDGTILDRRFTGYSQAIKGDGFINKTSALENAETSAVGRALAMMGIGVIESIASADEVNKAQSSTGQRKLATPKQVQWIRDTARQVNDQLGDDEEVDQWVESILTIKPAQVPVYKVKDAVDKLKEPEPTVSVPDPVLSDEEVDKAIKDIKDGKLPY